MLVVASTLLLRFSLYQISLQAAGLTLPHRFINLLPELSDDVKVEHVLSPPLSHVMFLTTRRYAAQ